MCFDLGHRPPLPTSPPHHLNHLTEFSPFYCVYIHMSYHLPSPQFPLVIFLTIVVICCLLRTSARLNPSYLPYACRSRRLITANLHQPPFSPTTHPSLRPPPSIHTANHPAWSAKVILLSASPLRLSQSVSQSVRKKEPFRTA